MRSPWCRMFRGVGGGGGGLGWLVGWVRCCPPRLFFITLLPALLPFFFSVDRFEGVLRIRFFSEKMFMWGGFRLGLGLLLVLGVKGVGGAGDDDDDLGVPPCPFVATGGGIAAAPPAPPAPPHIPTKKLFLTGVAVSIRPFSADAHYL